MTATRISVIIPAYNREGLIGPTLESLLRQTVPAMEIIVVDDGSTDQTCRVASSFGSKVRVIRQENKGPGAARNTGFKESKGEIIHFFDSDDIAAPNKHEVQLRNLREQKADIAYGPWVKGRFDGDSFTPENGVYQQAGIPDGNLVEALLCNWSIVPHACLFSRGIVEKSGGFPEDLQVGEDQYMFLRCLLAGARVAHSPETLEMYRVENSDKITASKNGSTRRLVEWARFLLKANQLCLQSGLNPNKWFEFQSRVYGVHAELQDLQFEGKEPILEELKSLFRGWRIPLYCSSGFFDRIRQGLQMRLFGYRAPSSMKMGRLSPLQVDLIKQSGFRPELSK